MDDAIRRRDDEIGRLRVVFRMLALRMKWKSEDIDEFFDLSDLPQAEMRIAELRMTGGKDG